MLNVDVARWEWVTEPWKVLWSALRAVLAHARWQRRITVPPMSDAWLREYEQQAGKHDDDVPTV